MTAVTREIIICNALGLHARPAMQFVDVANGFVCSITVHRDGPDPVTADGKSVMQMITLEAVQGTSLRVEAEGDDAEAALAELARLVEGRFGEEE